MDGRNDIRVELLGNVCGGYIVHIDDGIVTRTWGFADINDVKLWSNVLQKVIAKYEEGEWNHQH
jgi:hypothetical protein